jgi:hypothetical protein
MKNVSIQFDFKANITEFFSSILKLFGTFLFCSMIYRRRNGTFLYVPGFLKDETELFVRSKKMWKQNKSLPFVPTILRTERKTFWFDPEFGFENVSIKFFPGRKQENESFRS